MRDFRLDLANLLAATVALEADILYQLLEVPPQAELGDFALPCFKLAKNLRKAPPEIARTIADALGEKPDFLRGVEVKGGYLNFFLNREYFTLAILQEVFAAPKGVAASDQGAGQTVLVEYSSPNIAKPFHVGHAFTTVLGESLKRIYAHLGYPTLGLNHLGDYGTQFGKLIVAYELWGDEAALEKDAIKELVRIYVQFHEEAKVRPELDDQARERFRLLEQGSPLEVGLWQRFREESLSEFMRIYDRLGVHFDSFNGESFYSERMPAVVELLRNKGLLEESQGAQVVRLDEEKMPPCIILKSDGSSIYATRDLAAVLYREERWHFSKNIYVVGLPQSLHFKQVFKVLEKAGVEAAENCVHVGFGTVKFPDMKMSTRSGDVIILDDLLNEAVAKTSEIITRNASERGLDMSAGEIAEIAEKVGVGAVQYCFLKNGRERDIIFTWEDMLDFEGETAPYLQYTYARSRSILRKAGFEEGRFEADAAVWERVSASALGDEAEFLLARCFADFPSALLAAAQSYEPSVLARQLMQTARAFNKFYASTNILNTEDASLREGRLLLCAALCKVLAEGLELLGLRTVERM